jgi:hypothetical protein
MLALRGTPSNVFGSTESGGKRVGSDNSHVYGDFDSTDWIRFDIGVSPSAPAGQIADNRVSVIFKH